MFENFGSKLTGFLKVFKKKVAKGAEIVKTVKAKVEKIDKEKVKAAKKQLGTLSKKAFLAGTRNNLKKFYSDKNYKSALSLVSADKSVLSLREFSVDVNLPKALGVTAPRDSFNASEKLNQLHFFSLLKEVKLQKELIGLFGEDKVLPSKLAKERFTVLSRELEEVSPSVLSAHKKRGFSSLHSERVAKIEDNLKSYTDVLKLLK